MDGTNLQQWVETPLLTLSACGKRRCRLLRASWEVHEAEGVTCDIIWVTTDRLTLGSTWKTNRSPDGQITARRESTELCFPHPEGNHRKENIKNKEIQSWHQWKILSRARGIEGKSKWIIRKDLIYQIENRVGSLTRTLGMGKERIFKLEDKSLEIYLPDEKRRQN